MKYKAILSLLIIIVVCFCGCKEKEIVKDNDIEKELSKADTTIILSELRKANSFTANFPDSVKFYAEDALKLSKEINFNRGIDFSNYYLGVAEWSKGNYPESIAYHKKTLNNTNNEGLKALCLRDISLSLIYSNKHEEARNYLDQSIEIFEKLDNKSALTLAYINYGLIESYNENYLLALAHYHEALKLSEETKNLTNKSLILNNLGVINSKLEMNPISLDYYQQAYDIVKESGDLKLRALYLNNIANIDIELNNYKEALLLIDSGLMLTEESGDKRSKLFLLTNKGKALQGIKEFDLAIQFYKQANELANETGVRDNALKIQTGLGTTYFEMGNFNMAMTHLNKALNDAEQEADKEIIKEASELMAKIYALQLDFENAFIYMKMSNEMADSLSKSKIVKQFTQMEMQFEFDKEVYENELVQQKINLQNKQKIERQRFLLYVFILIFSIILFFVFVTYRNYRNKQKLNLKLAENFKQIKEQNRLIANKNNDLESLNETKDKLFSLIAHDLTSPFNTILGFAEMFSDQYDSIDETKRKHYLKQIYQSSKQAFNLLVNLLVWARSQKGSIEIEMEDVILYELINKSVEPFLSNANEKKINIHVNIPDNITVRLDKFTMQSSFGNLINNAIKFTKPGGHIDISIVLHSSYLEIKISDDGIGIAPNRINNLFKIGKNHSTPGTNNEKGTGLGLIICKDFIAKNGGKLKVESKLGKGSTFKVILPL